MSFSQVKIFQVKPDKTKKKILIYGAGVIGSIFAAKLFAACHKVTVLAHGKRLAEIKENGIVLRNPKT